LSLSRPTAATRACEADHGYLGTITADDLTLRISEAADGEDAVRQVLKFAGALTTPPRSPGADDVGARAQN